MSYRFVYWIKPIFFYGFVTINLTIIWFLLIKNHNQVIVVPQTQSAIICLQGKPSVDYLERVRELTQCTDKSNEYNLVEHHSFTVLENYFKPPGSPPQCHETVTYTTHGDFTFLDNVVPLVLRWLAPISIAVYCPGYDYELALDSVVYLRNCLPESNLVHKFVSFHFYFDRNHTPVEIHHNTEELELKHDCAVNPPYKLIDPSRTYRSKMKLPYFVNVGRNIARKTATTHFVLASDIELYPSPGVPDQFLQLYARLGHTNNEKEVFVLSLYEVASDAVVPLNKRKLKMMWDEKIALPFHYKICADCHLTPKYREWLLLPDTDQMNIFTTTKRMDNFKAWEPFYISSNQVPLFDEALNWEGKFDKQVQAFILCIEDYDFHLLDNAFLVHRPGFKEFDKAMRPEFGKINANIIKNKLLPEILSQYGYRKGCFCIPETVADLENYKSETIYVT